MKLIELTDGTFTGFAQLGNRPVYIQSKGKWQIGQVVQAFGRLYVACKRQKKPRRTRFCLLDVNAADVEY